MEQQYLDLLRDVLQNGTRKEDRTGTGTLSVFGRQIRCDLSKGFPALTTKKLFWKGVVAELLWFLKGGTNVKELQDQGVHIWDEWARENGYLGPVYGKQWRRWQANINENIDQIAKVIKILKTNPDSRRMLVSAWNVGELESMALEPCHAFFQLYTRELSIPKRLELLGRKYGGLAGTNSKDMKFLEMVLNQEKIQTRCLDLHMYQRSADLFLGVPFNIASYALLTHMLAQVTGLKVGELIITFGDAHIYLNHLDQVKEQLSREPKSLPSLWMNPDITDIDGFQLDDFKLLDYAPHPAIKAPISI